MGEIRSTLDIIMEKARDVEVTEQDKTAFMEREIEGKIRGFLQKYLDGVLSKDRFQSEMASIGRDRHAIALSVLRRECLKRMAPDGDNRGLIEILADMAGLDTRPVEEVILRYRQDQKTERAGREAILKDRLAEKGISGSAAMPNLSADPEWVKFSTEARRRFQQEMAGLLREP